ncbi:hypothetical protein SeMB42_g03754 [Synchytrium endobioticum]|uniref:Uncharacterized protein n=1 Tax=Synchytrium endobioticum TaxID=286115 RepID=A0A507CSN3_9FUNG|nr:hypothetical protein SeLEV6574_g05727 [Synchytrium endobioticum]TPX46313.1 hypothetical protein SeMB42_g03754 [Synchytrium endobioticum]
MASGYEQVAHTPWKLVSTISSRLSPDDLYDALKHYHALTKTLRCALCAALITLKRPKLSFELRAAAKKYIQHILLIEKDHVCRALAHLASTYMEDKTEALHMDLDRESLTFHLTLEKLKKIYARTDPASLPREYAYLSLSVLEAALESTHLAKSVAVRNPTPKPPLLEFHPDNQYSFAGTDILISTEDRLARYKQPSRTGSMQGLTKLLAPGIRPPPTRKPSSASTSAAPPSVTRRDSAPTMSTARVDKPHVQPPPRVVSSASSSNPKMQPLDDKEFREAEAKRKKILEESEARKAAKKPSKPQAKSTAASIKRNKGSDDVADQEDMDPETFGQQEAPGSPISPTKKGDDASKRSVEDLLITSSTKKKDGDGLKKKLIMTDLASSTKRGTFADEDDIAVRKKKKKKRVVEDSDDEEQPLGAFLKQMPAPEPYPDLLPPRAITSLSNSRSFSPPPHSPLEYDFSTHPIFQRANEAMSRETRESIQVFLSGHIPTILQSIRHVIYENENEKRVVDLDYVARQWSIKRIKKVQ